MVTTRTPTSITPFVCFDSASELSMSSKVHQGVSSARSGGGGGRAVPSGGRGCRKNDFHRTGNTYNGWWPTLVHSSLVEDGHLNYPSCKLKKNYNSSWSNYSPNRLFPQPLELMAFGSILLGAYGFWENALRTTFPSTA
jgi:hypothetical protein